jgi:hypothetical protein
MNPAQRYLQDLKRAFDLSERSMAVSETAYLTMMWARNECPTCRRAIPEGKCVGTGRTSDGGFCSLDCYARYYAMELTEKAALLRKMGSSATNES